MLRILERQVGSDSVRRGRIDVKDFKGLVRCTMRRIYGEDGGVK